MRNRGPGDVHCGKLRYSHSFLFPINMIKFSLLKRTFRSRLGLLFRCAWNETQTWLAKRNYVVFCRSTARNWPFSHEHSAETQRRTVTLSQPPFGSCCLNEMHSISSANVHEGGTLWESKSQVSCHSCPQLHAISSQWPKVARRKIMTNYQLSNWRIKKIITENRTRW